MSAPTARRGSSAGALAVATLLAALFAYYSVRLAFAVVAVQRHLDRQRRDAAVDSAARDGRGHASCCSIAFVDELVLEMARTARACETPDEALHTNE